MHTARLASCMVLKQHSVVVSLLRLHLLDISQVPHSNTMCRFLLSDLEPGFSGLAKPVNAPASLIPTLVPQHAQPLSP